eukprot:5218383-Amphidinium_carterae.1
MPMDALTQLVLVHLPQGSMQELGSDWSATRPWCLGESKIHHQVHVASKEGHNSNGIHQACLPHRQCHKLAVAPPSHNCSSRI